jgi:hypothetical protein
VTKVKKKNEYKLPTKPMLYIAYGSNINLPQMAFRCPHSTVVGTAMVKTVRFLVGATPSRERTS